ncbi:MAG TPA: sulfate ABC transporter substrate-binding protein [bacterium]|nr:sulfate ABC transporter substrate-binding protein [bacterium]
MKKLIKVALTLFFTITGSALGLAQSATGVSLLNVSYDPTRELYQEYNKAFTAYWKIKTGQDVTVEVSNGGSGKQSRAILDGLEADVATLGLSYDIDVLADKGQLLSAKWQKRLPNNSAPYTSVAVFLVRKGNPKNIKDWNDLARPDVQVIAPNPKTSAGGRGAFVGAWGYELKQTGDQEKAKEFVSKIYKNIPVLDSGARGSTTTFVERGIGDALITWENEADLAAKELGKGQFEVIYPSISILGEPSVAVIDKNVEKHGTAKVAEAYLKWLYSKDGQEIEAHNYYRPRNKEVLAKYASQFPKVKLFTIDELFGGWKKAQAVYFADGGIFDQIYQSK